MQNVYVHAEDIAFRNSILLRSAFYQSAGSYVEQEQVNLRAQKRKQNAKPPALKKNEIRETFRQSFEQLFSVAIIPPL